MQNTDPNVVILLTAVINAAVSWGAFRTQLAWLRADLTRAHERIDALAQKLGVPDIPRYPRKETM